jgi:hypothetical protein
VAARLESPTHGSVSRGSAPAGRPPQRDESDASIQFDLPDPPPEPPAAARTSNPPARPEAATDTPRAAVQPTAPSPSLPAAPKPGAGPTPAATDPPKSRPPGSADKKKGFVRPPVLPAAPLVHGTTPTPPLPPTGAPAKASPDLSGEADPGEYESVIWKRVKRKVLFWQAPTDTVRVGVFGPAAVAHSGAPRLTVFLYPPGAADSVATLARAFQHDAVLLGIGALAQPLARGARLTVHLAVAHTAVTTPLSTFAWQGQPHRLTFDLVVPREAPGGPVAGVVSVGKDDVRLGKAEFRLHIRPPKR